MSLLPVEEAQARLLALAAPLPIETIPLLDARGRLLAEPLVALRDQPWADLSAMDGYAIRHADLPGPWRLRGASRAGGARPTYELAAGEAMRIFTGAPMPGGADCVLVQEEASVEGDHVRLSGDGPGAPGRNMRVHGSDFAVGKPILDVGCRLNPPQLAVAAMAGHAAIAVRRRPRIALIGSGDELAAIGTPLRDGQIPASNGVMLAAMLEAAGAEVVDHGIVPDDLDMLTRAFRAAATADAIVSTGGASVGDHDLVAPAILAAGGALDFWKIAMRPGKPLMAGRLGDACVLGLPGNPVSAFVCATLFLLPLVRRLSGEADPLPQWQEAATMVALPGGGIRAEYIRATVVDGEVSRIADRDSAALLPLAHANALVERPAGTPAASPGDRIRVL
ncbi:MAG: gephyrin-like molybdotransferase Glp, partial [Sphingobium sp.]